MADQHRSRATKRKRHAIVEEDSEDEFYSDRTMRQDDSVPSPMPIDAPHQDAVPAQDAVPNVDGAMDVGNARPNSIIGYCLKPQQQENVPVPVAGKTVRFRGICLMNIGWLYSDANAYIHRIGAPVESSFEVKGTVLYGMRSAFAAEAIYRVTLSQCDAPDQSGIGWHSIDSGHGCTADEYCNLLELGKDCIGQLMMFTICRSGACFWGIIRQIPGKVYTLQECVSLLRVPTSCRADIQDFGNKTWTNGDNIPELWISKNLDLKNVSNKIRNIMRQ